MRRTALSALTTLILLGAGTVVGTPAIASSAPASCGLSTGSFSGSLGGSEYLCAKEGDLLDVRIGDVHATQPSLGYDEVYYKLGRYILGKDAVNKKFDDWCEANGQVQAATASETSTLKDPTSFTCELPVGQETTDSIAPMKTAVVGPRGELYLTDGHHTLTSFYETPDGGPDTHVRLRVLGNLSNLSPSAFWAAMEKNKWVWARDVDGNPVSVQSLPKGVGLANFTDDKYRSLMYFARDIGFTSGSIPFQEFYWGAWARDTAPVDLTGWNSSDAASYLNTVKAVTKAQTALAGDSVVDSGFTATDLGVLTAWNDGKVEGKGEFAKLSKPYSDEKPGKIAYALEYKAGL
ncbi:ParB/Srx family N-terminal domain-containing protein [Rhodococcus sp. IEGM 1379]|uniref:ParB/Srx family N-terminal domain-containing protein n=1 Tax=Rhodococcus sp. IEGM 1379 TaxID=3047086 RepID=UPI0024B85C3E|nr:ParB/Srx family N-terminal domain-containing protein [Rhodococcus sp. IEGM 1379]MDI9916581.1 ParB/Srx family N-terminal domain-containing protein [Rhodococcus sp. IEGM 1379]